MSQYKYNHHEERGHFDAYVLDENDNVVFEVHYPDFYEDEESGELIEGTTIFEDGFMKNSHDVNGLEKHLKSLGILKEDDELVMEYVNGGYMGDGGETPQGKIYQKVKISIYDVDMGGDKVYSGDHWFPKDKIVEKSNKELGEYILKKYMLDYGNTYSYKVTRTQEFKERMETGGRVVSGIKNKLNKKDKGVFSLPIEVVVLVPSTKNANEKIGKAEFANRIEEVQTYLSTLFGGHTSQDADGGYTSDEKGLINEDIYAVTSFAQPNNFNNKFEILVNKIKDWCKMWGQESIGLILEGDMFYIDKDIIYADGGFVSGNKEMIKSQIKEIKHHANELEDTIDKQSDVEAWVVGKMERSTTDLSDVTHYLDGRSEFEKGGVMAKGGEIASIKKRVDEVNALIKLGIENDIEVVDNSTTWEAPMKYKPLKYSNGVLYIEYQELDLYSYLKGRGTKYETKKEKVTKYDDSYGYGAGVTQKYMLNDIAKMYRKALRLWGITYEDGGMMDDMQMAKSSAMANIDYDDVVKDAMEYAGSDWLNMTKSQKDELISEMYHQRRQYIGSLEDGGEIEEEEEYDYENDLFKNVESLPQNVQNVIEKYDEDWEYTYENCANMQDELEQLGYTFDYYLDATPYNLRKMKYGGMMAMGGKIAVRNESLDEKSEIDGRRRYAVEIQDERSGDVLDYDYFDSEKEARDFISKYAKGRMMAMGGMAKKEWVAIYENQEMPNERKTIETYGNTKDEAIRNVRMSEGYYGIKKPFELIDVYEVVKTSYMGFDSRGKVKIRKEDGGMMAMGGETFDDKVQSISKSLLERKKVAPSVQKDYGKTYNKQEALDSARRIVGSMVKKSKN